MNKTPEAPKICPIISLSKEEPFPCLCYACAWWRESECSIWVIAEMLQGIDRTLYEG